MLIGEGPGAADEQFGDPFMGTLGNLLHQILGLVGLTNYYETHLVACRACSPQTDASGSLVLRHVRGNPKGSPPEPVYRDEPPTPVQYAACLPRLYEEIYLVDPTVIIGLGSKVCEALMGHSVTITRMHGEPVQIEIPGAGYVPVLTDKKQDWMHRIPGETKARPVCAQNMPRYYFMPTLDLTHVLRELSDQGPDSLFRQLIGDIKKALRVHEAYNEMVFGHIPTCHIDLDEGIIQRTVQATDQHEE